MTAIARTTRIVCAIDITVRSEDADSIAAELRRIGGQIIADHHASWGGPAEIEVRVEDRR